MQVSSMFVYAGFFLMLQSYFRAVQGWKVLKNDATEIIPEYHEDIQQPEPVDQSNSTMMNRAKHGGRMASSNTEAYSASDLSCRELCSTRYITDGLCRSSKPVKELVCSGQCVPSHLVPNSIIRGKWWQHNSSDYRCVPAHSRTQRVQLECPNNENRTYKIRVVTSCKCKRYTRHHNQSEFKEKVSPKPRRSKKRSRLSRVRSKGNNHEIESTY
ncbi:sclerostin [Huso huso]|uniref:Sclerostin n=1 Tax=Huso huso TaxID=61971 RepID=A0ABR0YKC3_HUSHU